MQHWGHGPIIVCSHNDSRLTLTYFMARSNLALLERVKTTDFSGTITDFVMKLASLSHNDKWYLLTSKFYPCPGALSILSLSTFSNIFFSKATWWIEAILHMEPPWVGETKVCLQGVVCSHVDPGLTLT